MNSVGWSARSDRSGPAAGAGGSPNRLLPRLQRSAGLGGGGGPAPGRSLAIASLAHGQPTEIGGMSRDPPRYRAPAWMPRDRHAAPAPFLPSPPPAPGRR